MYGRQHSERRAAQTWLLLGGYLTGAMIKARGDAANQDLIAGRLPNARFEPRVRGEKIDERADIDSLSWVDSTAVVKAGARIVNSVVEANCIVEEKAMVTDSVLRRASRVGTSAVVTGSAIGPGCHIGRNAVANAVMLGDKSVLTDYSTVGKKP